MNPAFAALKVPSGIALYVVGDPLVIANTT